jgi:hypothetical protein
MPADEATKIILETIQLEPEQFRLGNTKVRIGFDSQIDVIFNQHIYQLLAYNQFFHHIIFTFILFLFERVATTCNL